MRKETKNEALRRAILGIHDENKAIPEAITWKDVQGKWSQLFDVRLTPNKVLELANSDDESILPDTLMREFMDSLSWYNGYHS